MKLIPLLAVSAVALGLAGCEHDRPRGYAGVYGYSERVVIDDGRYRDRDYQRDDRRDRVVRVERSRYDDRRRGDRRDDRDWGRDRDRDRNWDGDRRRGDDRRDYRY